MRFILKAYTYSGKERCSKKINPTLLEVIACSNYRIEPGFTEAL